MATFEQESNTRQNLTKTLTTLVQIKLDDLARDELGRDLNFRTGLQAFERVLKLFRDLSEVNLDNIPFNRLNQLNAKATDVLSRFNNVKSFSLQQFPNNPTQARDQLINQIHDSYDDYFDQVAPVIAYSVRKGVDFDKLENEARQTVEKLNSITTNQEQARIAMMSEIEGTLEKIKRAAQEVGVAQHAVHFKQEADEHKKAASKWLIATAAMAIITFVAGYVSIDYFVEKLPTLSITQSIQLTVAKVIIFSLLFTSVVWTGRIYRAHRHNYVVNKHRQNALSTFETFIKAANDDQTKSAVLLQTTNCIFSQQHTGYVSHEAEAAGSPQILEIIRGIAGPQSKA